VTIEKQELNIKKGILGERMGAGCMAIFYHTEDKFSIMGNTNFMTVYQLSDIDSVIDIYLSDVEKKTGFTRY
jgi:hypothetical protein